MSEPESIREFKEGLTLLRNNYANKALAHFSRAAELDKTNPFYMSYLGLALAAAERRWDEAEEICLSALRMKRTQPELYLNLHEVYRLQGKRLDAVDTLITGLHFTKRDRRLVQALSKFGMRRPPVLSFLERTHFLNRHLGRLRYKVLKTLRRDV